MADVGNYQISQGIVSIQIDGVDLDWRDIGNAPLFEFEGKVGQKEHWSSRTGVRSLDLVAPVEKTGMVDIEFDEMTQENLNVMLYGVLDGSTINILQAGQMTGKVKCTQTNTVGPKKVIVLPKVAFFPNGKLSFIGKGDYTTATLQARVFADIDTGSFGTVDPV